MARLLAVALAVLSTVSAINFPPGIDPSFVEWANSFQKDGVSRNPFGADTQQVLVNIKNGTIRGQTALTIEGHTTYNYLGVPYAKAPVGELRFKPPQPYEGWGDEIYNATIYPKSCPQWGTNLTFADEDCLYVSVHSRRPGGLGTGPLLPVTYFVHGGAFIGGQNSYYDASKLLEEEIVLVTTQYRMGPLGFFYTGDNTVSGNNGMKDMVQGLRWIQENIQAFGGDPNQVTVMGESAGAISSLYMLISPLARGLFHKVIAMSGTPLMDLSVDRNPVESARRLGQVMGCTWETNDELVACLMEADDIELSRGGMLGLNLEDIKNFKLLVHGGTPVVEGDVPGAFLTDDPAKLFREGQLADVPVLMGTVQHEGIVPSSFFHFAAMQPYGLTNNTKYVREQLFADMLNTWNVDETNNGAPLSQAISAGYLSPGVDRGNFTQVMYPLVDLSSVLFFKGPLLRTADIISPRLSNPVYLYNFEYYSQNEANSLYHLAFTVLPIVIGGGEKPPMKPGICHADDLMYMFRLPFVLTPQDTKFSRTYVKLFTNFIVHGNPTPEPSEEYPTWPSYTIDGQHYMKLDLPFEVKQDYTSNWKLGMKGVEGVE